MGSKMEKRCLKTEVRAVETAENGRIIEGLGCVYNTWSEVLFDEKRGYFREIILPGAADGLIDTSDVIACRNHDSDKLLARTTAGTLTLTDTPEGIKYSFVAPNTSVGNDTLEDVRLGNINASSFRFVVGEDEWNVVPQGISERTIIKFASLHDVSPVTYPAYEAATVEARAKAQMAAPKQPGEAYYKSLMYRIK